MKNICIDSKSNTLKPHSYTRSGQELFPKKKNQQENGVKINCRSPQQTNIEIVPKIVALKNNNNYNSNTQPSSIIQSASLPM